MGTRADRRTARQFATLEGFADAIDAQHGHELARAIERNRVLELRIAALGDELETMRARCRALDREVARLTSELDAAELDRD